MKKGYIFCALLFLGVFAFSFASANVKGLAGYVFINDSWISLNCADEGSCATTDYQVVVDENNNLSGYAYSETFGLINFNSEFGKVKVNADKEITGWVFTEKTGWLYFNGEKIVLSDELESKVNSAENEISLLNKNLASISESQIMDILKQLCEAIFGKSQCAVM